MKKLLTILFAFLLTFTSISNIKADEGHIYLYNNELTSEELTLLENDLCNIEREYSLSIYFLYDTNLSLEELKDKSNNILNKNTNSNNSVILAINADYYVIDVIGTSQDIINNNVSTIWDKTISGNNFYEYILNYYQCVVSLINSETYTSNVPLIEETKSVVDFAGIFNEEEYKELTNTLNSLKTKYDMDVVVLTTNTLNGMSPQNYADDFYDYNNYSNDGILFLISFEDRDWYVSTKGEGMSFNDYAIDYAVEQMMNDLGNGDYYNAFKIFADNVDYFLTESQKGNDYDYNHKVKTFNLDNVALSCFIGVVVTIVVLLILNGQLKSVKTNKFARNYVVPGSFYLTGFSDLLISSHISKTPRPKDTDSHSSGGGSHSSFHTSSSGSSHGGHGGKF